jgi:hypothetical protein
MLHTRFPPFFGQYIDLWGKKFLNFDKVQYLFFHCLFFFVLYSIIIQFIAKKIFICSFNEFHNFSS